MKNKLLYAVVFPFLLFVSYFGRNSRPEKGAGVLVRARKVGHREPIRTETQPTIEATCEAGSR